MPGASRGRVYPQKTMASSPAHSSPPCEFGLCDGSGFLVDELTDTARDCRCRPLRIAQSRNRSLEARIPKRYRAISFEHTDVIDIERRCPTQVREIRAFVGDISGNLDAGRGLWLAGSVGTGKTALAMIVSKAAIDAGRSVAIYSCPRLLSLIRESIDGGGVIALPRPARGRRPAAHRRPRRRAPHRVGARAALHDHQHSLRGRALDARHLQPDAAPSSRAARRPYRLAPGGDVRAARRSGEATNAAPTTTPCRRPGPRRPLNRLRGVPGIVIVGAQWGDEGKGKVTDLLAERADAVVRFQGGNNAGHTIVRDGARVEVPPRPLGDPLPGQALHHRQRRRRRPQGADRRARRAAHPGHRRQRPEGVGQRHLIMPYHLLLDQAGEARLGKLQIGTTRRGIGPCYADKAARLGIRVQDMLDEKILRKKIVAALEPKRLALRPVRPRPLARPARDDRAVRHLRPPARAAHRRLRAPGLGRARRRRVIVLFEGAQGAMLDIDHGTYPFVTSSNPIAGAACVGAGVGPRDIDEIWGVCKAYATRVGAGPFPTELDDELGEEIRRLRRRVRHDDRTPAPHRLARPRRAALRGAPELALGARDHQARRPHGLRARCCVCTRYRGEEERTLRPLPLPPVGAPPRGRRVHRARGLERGHRRVPRGVRVCRRPRATTSPSSTTTSACRWR